MQGEQANSTLLDSDVVRGFVRMCADGWRQGWHERNGGNASCLLTEQQACDLRPCFDEEPGEWVSLGVSAKSLAGALFLVTATGSYMQNIERDTIGAVGIVELDDEGAAYRRVWGFRGGGRPTSEFAGHVLIHAARVEATGGESRVIYHAHPTPIIALSKMLPHDAGSFTRVLWRAMTECVVVFPEGVGVVGFQVPGSMELALASACEMKRRSAVVWAHHGLLCSGGSFDDAFGRYHAIVKAAEIYLAARSACGGQEPFNQVSDDELRAIARAFGLRIDESLLG